MQAIESNITTQLTALSTAVATNAALIYQLQETTDRVLTQVQDNAAMLAQIERTLSAPQHSIFGKIAQALGLPSSIVNGIDTASEAVMGVSEVFGAASEIMAVAGRRRRDMGWNGTTHITNNTSTELASVLELEVLDAYVIRSLDYARYDCSCLHALPVCMC